MQATSTGAAQAMQATSRGVSMAMKVTIRGASQAMQATSRGASQAVKGTSRVPYRPWKPPVECFTGHKQWNQEGCTVDYKTNNTSPSPTHSIQECHHHGLSAVPTEVQSFQGNIQGLPEKQRDWCHKQFISIPNNKLHGSPFSVIPLASNTLFHPSLPRFYALLEGFFWDAPQLCCYGPLDGLHAFKMGPLDDPLELGEKKKVTRSKVKWIGRLFQHGDGLLGQELLDAQGVVSRCIVVVKQPWFVLPQFSSLLVHWVKQKL